MRWLGRLILLHGLILSWIGPVAAAGPSLTVTTPKNGELIPGSAVTVTFAAADFKIVPTTVPVSEAGKHPEANKAGEGHVHLILDLQPLIVWEKTDPYIFNNVPPGEHQLMVELVNNDHSSLSPRVMQIIQFRSGSSATLPNTGMPGDRASEAALFALGVLAVIAGGLLLRRWRA